MGRKEEEEESMTDRKRDWMKASFFKYFLNSRGSKWYHLNVIGVDCAWKIKPY
jgi:hypothetical protein